MSTPTKASDQPKRSRRTAAAPNEGSRSGFRGRLLTGTEWFEHYYTGERVGVLAPGAEAAEILPEVLATAESVILFQECPAWIVPLAVPCVRLGHLTARWYLRVAVPDAWTRRQLTPHKDYDSRDVTVSPSYYRALQDPRTRLIHWPAYTIAENGVRAVDGVEYRVDTVVVGATSKFAGPLARGENRNL